MGWEKGLVLRSVAFTWLLGRRASARGLGFRACLALVILVLVALHPPL